MSKKQAAALAGTRDITIVGARQHNLKNINVTFPRNSLVVITGPSGSGKSSLAFDTLYAEGQRRYVESLSAYARQFLDRMQKPDVEHIDGLSPAIAIEQRSAGGNPRSIVATTTEIYDYLRLLYAHIGKPHCPQCHQPVKGQSAQQICDHLNTLPEGRKMMLLAPYIRGKKGEHREILEKLQTDGFVRARIDGDIRSLEDEIKLEKNLKHDIAAVVDRLIIGKTDATRLNDSVERCLQCGGGMMIALIEESSLKSGWREETISEHLACIKCNISIGELLPRSFSFNSPYGACPECHGLGTMEIINQNQALDPSKSLASGAVPLLKAGPRRLINYNNHILRCVAEHFNVDLKTRFDSLPNNIQKVFLHGSGNEEIDFSFRWRGRLYSSRKAFEGIIPILNRRYRETESVTMRERLKKVMEKQRCPTCSGARLRRESLAVTVGGQSIAEVIDLSVNDAHKFITSMKLLGEELVIAGEIVREIRTRLGFLISVGLDYLTLNRESGTLSGGEAQRIRLATQVGSGLTGVLYVLDEPSIGLHQRDNHRLLETLTKLRDAGNSIVVVEHDLDTILAADHILDIGPGAGVNGGEIVASGPPSEVKKSTMSLTGKYLKGILKIDIPEQRKLNNGHALKIVGARMNNLKNINVDIPLGTFCCITGVSGSGKSTLVNGILTKAVHRHFNRGTEFPGPHRTVKGLENIDKMIVIDQSPIGRTPRSNPATYTGAFDLIRQLFSRLPEARLRGYKPGRFSFNVKGGRCEECQGGGVKKIEMQFLPDVYVTCEMCKGHRYNRETLSVLYKGRSIADVLNMTVEEANGFFDAIPKLKRLLKTLYDVGLGYVLLGQAATTLSGGEAQRVKLASELARIPRGHTLYILDEPTTGLHMDDIKKLLQVLFSLRDQNNSVLVIEHNLDVIKVCDWIIDLGPEGGDEGGKVIAKGTPEQVAKNEKSYTGQFLSPILNVSG